MIYATASRADLPGMARLFMTAFEGQLGQVFGDLPPPRLVEEAFRLCYDADPKAMIVAREGHRVMGYVYAPASTQRLWHTALVRGYLMRWVAGWVRRRHRMGFGPMRILLLDRFPLLRSGRGLLAYGIPARVVSLAVETQVRRQGVGTHLLLHALRSLERRGVSTVCWEVRSANEPALRLCTRLGFKTEGRVGDKAGEWLVMVRHLSSTA